MDIDIFKLLMLFDAVIILLRIYIKETTLSNNLKESPTCVLIMCCAVLRPSVLLDPLQPHGLQSAWLLCPQDSPGKNPWVGYHALLQGIFPTLGLKPVSTLQADSLRTGTPGMPKNTGVGSISHFQGIFLTQGLNQGQESNWGFLSW